MQIKLPSVGPVLGYTTEHQARLLIRGQRNDNFPVFAAVRYRCHGALDKNGDVTWIKTAFIQLTQDLDMTGVIVLHDLEPETEYIYQAGWFSLPSHLQNPQALDALELEWPDLNHEFQTPSSKLDRPHSYIVGSCRYLRLTLDQPALPALGDRIFKAINRQQLPTDAVVMLGDQVYVDDLNIIAPDRSLPAILLKYRTAFSQPHIKSLMANTPTYMILDDHEIEDNWPARRNEKDHALYRNAIKAYEIYQCSHSPAHALNDKGQVDRKLSHYWYQFGDGNIEWFVLDTRTQRALDKIDPRIIDEQQEKALLNWLVNSPARVKFIASSVMFYPDLRNDRGDTWKSFPQQRNRILETIRLSKIRNVIFVCGDVHGSMTCRLTHSADPTFDVHTIVSSPFCNTRLLPYAKASDFILESPLAQVGDQAYQQKLTSQVISEDNFARITLICNQLEVDFYDYAGTRLESTHIPLV